MTQTQTHSTPLLHLCQQWRAFGLMALAFARHLLALQRAGTADAWAKANMLELWVRAALVVINQQIADAHRSGEPECAQERHALAHLQAIAIALLALAMFVQDLKSRLALRGSALFAGARTGAERAGITCASFQWTAPLSRPAYLDSS